MLSEEFDYIIVGAGSAGCLLANRLSADPAKRVLLLEAGGKDNYPWIHIPVGYLFCIGNPRTDWCYRTLPDSGLGGRSLTYSRGKVLGGCSSINGMIYMRGQAADYDHWAALGNAGWGWGDVLPHFIAMEDHFDPTRHLHGHGGEWRVEKQRLSWEILDAFRAAAAEQGIAPTADFNQGDNAGCGYFEVNQKNGLRWNCAQAFLHPVRYRANLTVLTGAEAETLIVERGRAAAIAFMQQGQRHIARCRGEIVLAAGAVGSPLLLQRSGIGPAPLLAQHGISPIHILPGVGANLQDHLQLRLVFKVRHALTLNQRAAHWTGKLAMAWEYLWKRSGPLSMSPSQLGAFSRSAPDVDRPDLEYHVQPLSLEKFGEPLHRFPAFTASVCHLRPHSRGHVAISGRDPAAPPAIQPNYLSHPQDQGIAAAAIRQARRIAASPALARYLPEEYRPGLQCQSDEELIEAAGRIGTTIFHPAGTCKMGADELAVVDARLRVHGIAGLRVADASIMPAITSGNTNSPTLMIASRAAQLIMQDNKQPAPIRTPAPHAKESWT
ncbi:GMC family oxidoreductase [Chromobacterium sp. IIBBL 290-4]|uniref:GMC family oxidoreductase n=1 Tax=Chromobacterium sp. IIBBL 290-4 TaxID=2953890 RepID=UPI0020B7CE28|nr:GMC family oxidoreductase N-terminal domain-containing protein [Chromobacterium sp. IIBBL 290-4]UTH74782.1 GMC family oxidoreductase N-terminal domain-containing protein [Chromobacterium sp. IIBBL 290-4]